MRTPSLAVVLTECAAVAIPEPTYTNAQAGICRERKTDVTTVTVTVDPSVPSVEPRYP